MDYSSSLNDADNPAGASPWGNSPVPSPQNNRSFSQSFQSQTPDSPNMVSQEHVRSESYASEGGFGASARQVEASNGDYDSRPQTASSTNTEQTEQHIPRYEAGDIQKQHQEPHPGLAYNENQHSHSQQRPSQHSRPATRQAPHYFLHAKITGLERTGRKDPILRFDVKVRLLPFNISLPLHTFMIKAEANR